MQALFKNVKISGISSVIPTKEIDIEDEKEFYGNSDKKIARIKEIVGLSKRRVVSKNVTASDLCTQAASTLISEMKINISDIDALVFVVQNPDYICPATACIIHKNLELGANCIAFDVNQGCAGYVYGLYIASSLIEGGSCKKVLLCAGDTFSIHCNVKNRVTAPVFGDAGSATLLEYSPEETSSYYSLGADGNGYEHIIIPAGGATIPFMPNENDILFEDIQCGPTVTNLSDLHMDGLEIFNFTMNVVPENIKSVLNLSGETPETIEKLYLHQANKQIIQTVASMSGFDVEKAPYKTVQNYGNQTIASIPCAICDDYSKEEFSKNLKVLLSGFGIGLAWGSCCLNLDNIYCSGIREFDNSVQVESRENLISKWKKKLKGEI